MRQRRPRTKIPAGAARAPKTNVNRSRADPEASRYRVVKSKDHGDPGNFSWIVFDSAKPGPLGAFTYVADCSSSKDARLVANALNAYKPPNVAASVKASVTAMNSRARRRFLEAAALAEREVRQGGSTYTVDEAFAALKTRKVARRSSR